MALGNYAQAQQQLRLMTGALVAADLIAWYATYEAMRHSPDPYAQRYAFEQGYRDGQQDACALRKSG